MSKRTSRAAATPHPAPLGGLSVDQFMRRHWQRKPLLIRQAIPGFEPLLDAQSLAALAADDSVESRLVTRFRGKWALHHGPFEDDEVPPLSHRNWTLLVQGVDRHLDAAHDLLARFRFVPDARLDDLMISLAGDGGGVGPHVDSYDVFLLQAWGRRRWRIAPPSGGGLVPGLPLKILERFEPREEWVLEPGDMLYLPPGWEHDGIAEGPCMTYSVGFRAPSRREFLAAFLAEAADDPGGRDPRFGDAGRAPSRAPGELPDDLRACLRDWALRWRPDARAVDRFIGRFLTEPKPDDWFESRAPLPPARFAAAIARQGVRLDRRSRMLHRGARVFVNGECFDVPARDARILARLADRRALEPAQCARLSAESGVGALLRSWHGAGWVQLGDRSGDGSL